MPSRETISRFPDVRTLEHCAKALWEHETTAGWRKNNPWDSDDPFARRARLVRVERASVVLQAYGEAMADAETLARAVSASLTHGEKSPLEAALTVYLSKHPWSDL
jgi:uncharacterized protein YhjY with autotransporter beta-barrel domain